MREIHVRQIADAIKDLCIEANNILPDDIESCMRSSYEEEDFPLAKQVLGDLIVNFQTAREQGIPICQDTGMAVVFVKLGQDVHIVGGDYEAAIHQGVREGYLEGNLRCSVVDDPLRRVNTNDNTPAVIHTAVVPGDKISITVAPKGFGSENMSRLKMFTPSATPGDIVDFVVETVEIASGNPCPPVVVGVGIGGDFELCAYLAKKALCRDASLRNPDDLYGALEAEMLYKINALGIGPQAFGGRTTALAVNIETYPTHIAGLPVAVNMGCHVTRHKTTVL
ncbi:fumarate hydratase [Zongyangia hominis]|uniref:Fumarate hydratase n=1 Tax=Zongyangia hominis TaxID=2763677 RepID=A0A926EB42_9FIRM|nr:fumarate hydratase [Zongyangia hominis]MBC8569798.1 fumarate hydratase [Zongyangia hominis]